MHVVAGGLLDAKLLDKFYYRNPLAWAEHLVCERTDQGVDFFAKRWSPIRAMGNGKVVRASTTSGWPGGGIVQYVLTGRGSHKGETVYVSEFIVPVVKVGQWVNKGQVIAHFTRGYQDGVGIETGFIRTGTNEPCSTDTSGRPTAGGVNFTRWLNQLGCPTAQHFGSGPTHSPCR